MAVCDACPVWTPIRTRTRSPPGLAWDSRAFCIPSTAATHAAGEENTAKNPMLRFIVFGNAVNPRIATADVKLGRVAVRAGEPVLCVRSSANFDEHVFARAAELDFARDPNPHLAFGYGPHYCLGAQLARMELQVALETILARLPGLQIAVPEDQLTWHTGTMMHGLAQAPARLVNSVPGEAAGLNGRPTPAPCRASGPRS